LITLRLGVLLLWVSQLPALGVLIALDCPSIAHVDCPVLILRRAELAMGTSHTPSASPKL
jgi:hypothetical protein